MSFSDLVHAAERDVAGLVDKAEKLLPAGLPSDTREVAALAEDAAKVVVTLDPELEPIFQAIGSVGNTIEGALKELGGHLGTLKVKLAQRAAAPLAAPVPAPAGTVPVGVPDPAAPQPAAAQPTVNDLHRAADTAALARQAPPPAEGGDPNPLPAADPAAAAPTPAAAPPSTETPSAPAPAPGTADPAGGNPLEPETPAEPTPPAADQVPTSAELEAQAEAAFAALSPEEQAAFEAAEGLEQIPPAAPEATSPPQQVPPPAPPA